MKSTVVKRSITVAGRKTSVSLEDAFWNGLKEIAAARRMSVCDVVALVEAERQCGNLSSALRLFVLHYCRERCDDRASLPQPTAATGGARAFRLPRLGR